VTRSDDDRGRNRSDPAAGGDGVDDEEDRLPSVLTGLSAEESVDPMAVVGHELHRKTARRRAVEGSVSLAAVALIFVFVLPAVTGSHYSEIWHEISHLSGAWLLALTAIWMLGMLAYTGVLTNSLPGLTHPQALTVNFAGSAVSNVVPFGGAVGVGATYAIDLSWGFTMPSVTLSILVSGVWNVFAKLGMPVLALALLVLTGRATGGLLVPTLIGLLALIGAATVLVLVMRSEALATRVGGVGQRLVDPSSRRLRRSSSPDVTAILLDFRHSSIGLLRAHWWRLTMWVVLYNLGQFLLLLACVRSVGEGAESLGWIEVFAAFSFARLLETIPLTPSGVGFVETGAVAALIGFGGADAASAAAVFLFRGFTYLLEIPVGAGAWVVWATRRSWRRPIGSVPASAATATR
jgi:uncharacterized membrane protein YbhN (UPF0104 family)